MSYAVVVTQIAIVIFAASWLWRDLRRFFCHYYIRHVDEDFQRGLSAIADINTVIPKFGDGILDMMTEWYDPRNGTWTPICHKGIAMTKDEAEKVLATIVMTNPKFIGKLDIVKK